MSLSKIDFISPKITLYYNGRNSHISPIGGFLSLCLLALILVLIFYVIWNIIVNPRIESSFIYKQYENNKTIQTISYSGINHFIQLYSLRDKGYFGDLDNKNIIIYSIKDNKTSSFDNLNLNLANTEHWLYDKCEKIYEINKNLFEEISLNIPNYSKSICIRFYYNSNTKEYYEIGFDGYVSPNLETNAIFEKKNIYKIIIDKCSNYSFINSKMGYICNNENEINNYLQIYSEFFLYFLNNQIIPNNYKSPFEKFYYSVTSPINKNSFFDTNIIFSPIKLITENEINNPKELSSFILNNYYSNNYSLKNNNSKIGFFNFYLDNNIIIFHRKNLNILDGISHLGGITNILIFIFQIINYINYKYTILKHTKDLFHINTGIDFNSNYNENNEIAFVKRHMTNHNYKIKVFNNNNIINAEDINHKLTRNYYTKGPETKKKLKNHQNKKTSGKKNYFPLNFFSNNLNKNKETFLSKRSQTKYINNVNEIPMGKQLAIKNKETKRKSYMSQGYFVKNETRNKFNNNSILSKNQTLFDNEMSNNEIISNNDRTNFFQFRDGTLKLESPHRTSHETNILKSRNNTKKLKLKKTNRKKSLIENNDTITNILKRNLDTNSKGRHKSVNYTNQRKILENNNSLQNRFGILGKNSSSLINESSKQMLVSNTKLPLMLLNNKMQFESNKYDKYDDYNRIPTLINNNEAFTTNNNIPNVFNNSNTDPSNFLKSIIHNKIKFHMPENKKNSNCIGILGKKIKYFEFLKSLFVFNGKNENENKLYLINNFRNKLLSEEHIYRVFINLYLIEKVFQIDEAYKFDINELYNNL